MRVLVLSVVLLTAVVPAAAEEIYVLISRPQIDEPVFGEIELEAEVSPDGVSASVVFWVDGEIVGEIGNAPYRLTVDVGEENREHEIRAVATAPSGATAEAVRLTPAIPIDDVVRAELQQLYVTVVGTEGRVLDLAEDDFEVRDNGDLQDLVTFTAGHIPLAAAVLIDASASMRGRRLQFAVRGARAFAAGVEPEDEVSVRLFADRTMYESAFSSKITVSTEGLSDVRAEGGTALNDALYRAIRQLETRQGRRVVILLSDGIDSHSVLGMQEVTWLARRSRAMLYWVRTGRWESTRERYSAWKDNDEYRREYARLGKTVEESGGRIITLSSIEESESAMREILDELREQYVLGYYPSVSRNDGSWHRVAVRVDRPGSTVRARGGYVDY